MSNALIGLIPTLYSAAQTVARELHGYIPAVDARFDDKMAAVSQTVRVPISPAQAGADYTPAMTVSAGSDRIATYADVVLTKNRVSSFNMTGEEERALTSGGNDIATELFRQSIAQAMRTLTNEIEADLAGNVYKSASRAIAVADTSPFKTNLQDAANILKVLKDNGAPSGDLSFVLDTSAGAKLRGQLTVPTATAFNEASGAATALRQGNLWDLFGLKVYESGQVAAHTAGTGASYVTDGSSPVGDTSILVKTGTGTLLAGDIITFAADSTNKYVVNSGITAAGQSVGLALPGAKVVIADANAITRNAAYTPLVALHRGAAVLVVRPPAIEATPIIETQLVTDPVTGLTFMVVRAMGDGMVTYRVHAVWGYKVVQPEFIATLIG